jgi:leucyl aminopeptidase
MPTPYEVPRISAADAAVSAVEADLLVIPVAQDRARDAVGRFDAAVGGDLKGALDRGEFAGRPCETFGASVTDAGWRTRRVLFVGGGPRADLGAERCHRMAVVAVQAARNTHRARLAWADVEPGAIAAGARIETVAAGLTFGNFDNGVYKSRGDRPFFISEAIVVSGAAEAANAAWRGRITGEAVNGARLLINEPANRLTPTGLAEKGAELARVPGIAAEILDEARIRDLNMGLLLGVARGSAEPPRVLVLRYEPTGLPPGPTLGLVGKGITFDTGGLSLKAADGMERMKDDMAGGATVIAAVRAAALQQVPLRIMAVVPATENMPGGRATKPGDVLTSAAGLTVEVNNTDAEGRLVLGDALWYARRLGATHLIDVATLTGAVVVALGKLTTGLFGTPQPWVDHIREAAGRSGEKIWPMPLFEEYKDALKSEMADLINSPGRPAGSITAATFLKEFAGSGPWAHLDIAGTAWAEETKPWQPKGATGAMIRTLVEVARAGVVG